MATDVRSDLAIHPGEYLADELEARNMSQRDLARSIGRPAQTVSEIIRGRRSISADLAVALERALGLSARGWMNLQSEFELVLAYGRAGQPRSAAR